MSGYERWERCHRCDRMVPETNALCECPDCSPGTHRFVTTCGPDGPVTVIVRSAPPVESVSVECLTASCEPGESDWVAKLAADLPELERSGTVSSRVAS